MEEPDRLTHLDPGGAARMVEVGSKPETAREARAEALVRMRPATLAAIAAAVTAKGDVLQVARVAAILGAKRTAELIPLCHPLPISSIAVDLELVEDGVSIRCTARVIARTGVEMEALTGAAVAALTVVDMVKSLEPGLEIVSLRLMEKSGGRSGSWRRDAPP